MKLRGAGRWLLPAGLVGGFAALGVWSLVADDKKPWAIVTGVLVTVLGGFVQPTVDKLTARRARHDRRQRELADNLVAELPQSVAWLLHPDREVVAFFGRGWVLRQLATWCDDDRASVVRLVAAPGGHGKTRLAGQFARELAGWAHWRVTVGGETGAAEAVAAGEAPDRLLVTVDYADSRESSALARLLVAATRRRDGRVRVLLLARTAGPWWTSLSVSHPEQAALVDALTITGNVITLDAQDEGWEPEAIVDDAVTQFAAYLGHRRPGAMPRRRHDRTTPLLRLHAEALVAVLGGPRSGDGRHDVLDEVLGHEARYWWHRARRTPGLSLPADPQRATDLMRQVVGLAALLGAATHGQTTDLVRRVPSLATADAEQVSAWVDWLSALYPVDGAGGGRLGTLQPDLLAEHLAVEVLTGCTDGQRAVVFNRLTGPQAVSALTVLGRARAHSDVTALVDAALAADVVTMAEAVIDVAAQFPGLHAARLAHRLATADLDLDGLQDLALRVPRPSLELNQVGLTLTARLVSWTAEGLTSAARAKWLSLHALRLAEAGRRAEALVTSEEAVTCYRELAVTDRDTHLTYLAGSVNNHALRLAEVGRRNEALTTSEEAVQLRRELVGVNRDAHLPDLAMSVNNHALRLAEAGRHTEALTTSEEAVTYNRELAGVDRDAHLPDLATSVNNHATRLAEAGRHSDALTASQEAIHIHRELAGTDRDAHLPDLAMSVNNHALRLAGAGRHTEALTTSEEAVQLRRELVGVNRDAHLPDLATSVNNHAIRLIEAGKLAEALIVGEEAVSLHRELVGINRDAHLPGLAAAINNYAIQLAEAGRHTEAVTTSEEAVTHYRELAAADPDGYLSDLAVSLCMIGSVHLFIDGPPESALKAYTEGLQLLDKLVAMDREGSTDRRNDAARTLAAIHEVLGQLEEATEVRRRYRL